MKGQHDQPLRSMCKQALKQKCLSKFNTCNTRLDISEGRERIKTAWMDGVQ